jgi:hypothetical protein
VIEEGRQIIVLMNPPYATGASAMKKGKLGTGKTIINKEMQNFDLGKSSAQLYSQFVFRFSQLGKFNLCMFTKPTFITGEGFQKFRSKILCKWDYKIGFVMNAKDFEGVKQWPLCFTVWNLKN